MDIEKYDEYVRGPAREVITVETRIKSTNKGFAMLAKLGWSEGQPLGLSADARVDPIPFQVKNDLTGLGKTTQDFRMIETTVAERRKLDSERQRKETEDQRKAREASIILAALKSEITDTLKAFYCALCEKQFQNVAQYDEHTNSYAHHHKGRLRDMQANTRMTSQEDLDKRKEKERKREEKELRKIAKAAGIKMAKPATTSASVAPTMAPVGEPLLSSEAQPSNFKKAGWATVSATADPATSSRRSGWASLDSSTPPAPSAPAPPPPPPAPAPTSHGIASATPIFRTGGWTSLDTGSSLSVTSPPTAPPPPPPPPNVVPPPPPIFPMSVLPPGCPAPFPPASAHPSSGPLPPFPTSAPPPGGPPSFPPTRGGWGPAVPSDFRIWDQTSAPAPTFSQPQSLPPAAVVPPASSSLTVPVPPPATPQARTGWQQWKRGGSSKRK
ncbi:hypothetical protein AZE42_02577 [Rhizopogon vesiculosus]|uniref:G-patch domain-containing protein n=1 Tax=Rhizopogon vesiculosus TaxID=180088 RepID=A0A1J8QBH5_9AGAM|nr:hypothetical protein AZE42_02577 [Rhizopogon vesiculosus]